MSSTAQVDTGRSRPSCGGSWAPSCCCCSSGTSSARASTRSPGGGRGRRRGWAPFLVAFGIAMVTAFSYLELVTKYPQAAGAALHAQGVRGALPDLHRGLHGDVLRDHQRLDRPRAFASNLAKGFGSTRRTPRLITVVALSFMALVAAVNLRGVSERQGEHRPHLRRALRPAARHLRRLLRGDRRQDRLLPDDGLRQPERQVGFLAVTAATSLAFFAMVGFEDSVNMAEETHDPVRNFPKMMISGIGITGIIYILVALFAVAIVPVGVLGDSDTPLVTVVETAARGVPIDTLLPFISMFAVANSALINMLMASRLLYGMARQEVLPPFLGRVHATRQTCRRRSSSPRPSPSG